MSLPVASCLIELDALDPRAAAVILIGARSGQTFRALLLLQHASSVWKRVVGEVFGPPSGLARPGARESGYLSKGGIGSLAERKVPSPRSLLVITLYINMCVL